MLIPRKGSDRGGTAQEDTMMFVASLSRISVDMACIHHIDGNLPEEHGKQMGGSAHVTETISKNV